ncbi:hypothetical protein DPMN_030853 [Dreissena polymorpha]|uniref:Uncharacterized protein n=1 Tax=Dreissena polymorpha TaxID=45954 RepID=A0A9D4RGR9_DREPO|nr:hypothetical protein DPMN_030853 [Dreissena polymorpha]
MTADTDHVLAFLRRSTIRIDLLQDSARYRRQSSIDFYQLFANVSGGSVITTDKDNIGSAVNVITTDSNDLHPGYTVGQRNVRHSIHDQDIDVRIEDDQDFAVEPKIHSFDIKAGMNETEHFTIEGGPKGGVTT